MPGLNSASSAAGPQSPRAGIQLVASSPCILSQKRCGFRIANETATQSEFLTHLSSLKQVRQSKNGCRCCSSSGTAVQTPLQRGSCVPPCSTLQCTLSCEYPPLLVSSTATAWGPRECPGYLITGPPLSVVLTDCTVTPVAGNVQLRDPFFTPPVFHAATNSEPFLKPNKLAAITAFVPL